MPWMQAQITWGSPPCAGACWLLSRHSLAAPSLRLCINPFRLEACRPCAESWDDAGALKDIVVTPCDSYGNAGASGGRFAAELVPEDDESAPAIPCQVTESTRGQCLAIWDAQHA